MNVEQAKAALDAARKSLRDAEDARSAEIDAVKAKHAPAIDASNKAVNAAAQALREAENAATPDHEWEGTTVCRTVEKWSGSGWTRRKIGETTERGVVFTYRHGIDLGPGWTWDRPNPGEPMVRLLKKDGKPGLRTVKLKDARYHAVTWTLETTHD